jgi:peptidoglycan/xylan/chitin deacetylase (PgdA/CDA1 family)
MSGTNRLSCCITFDFDGMSNWIGSARSDNPSMISRGEFGAVAIPRILELLDRFGVRTSFAVPGHTAYAYPRLVTEIRDRGHELVHHGWVHENPARFDEAGERRVLEQGLEALHRVAGVTPLGYRSPAWDFSERTVDLLREYGFAYDSSCMGHDFYPYYLRSGDAWTTDTAYRFGQVIDLVEIPVTWSLDDFPAAEYVPGFNEGLKAPSAIEEMWRGDFDYAQSNCPDGVFVLTLHPQTTGRGHRMLLLERLLRHFTDCGAVFEPMGDYVARWRQTNSLAQWKAANPDLTGKHAINP